MLGSWKTVSILLGHFCNGVAGRHAFFSKFRSFDRSICKSCVTCKISVGTRENVTAGTYRILRRKRRLTGRYLNWTVHGEGV